MAVFDEATECLHPLPQYLGRHGYRFVTVQFCAARARSRKSGSDDRLENSIIFHKPIYMFTTNHGPESAMQRNFHLLFDQYGVDLVLYGHNYMRTYTL
jgi:3',5'-cyclic AMP phosphodiesterase CpdA